MRTLRASLFLLALAITGITSVSNSSAADFSAVWNGGNGNWDDPLHWNTNPNYPDNTGGVTYDATINSGSVFLDLDITVQRLFMKGGRLWGPRELTLNEGLTWTGGAIEVATINLGAGSVSTFSNTTLHLGETTILNNAGTVNQMNYVSGRNATINNLAGATWNMQWQSLGYDGPIGGFVFNNAGTFVVPANTSMFGNGVYAVFHNTGTVTLQSDGTHSTSLGLTGGGSSSGSFVVPAQTSLGFGRWNTSAGAFTLLAGSAITGGGSTVIGSRGTLIVAGNSTISTSLTNEGEFIVASGVTLALNGFTQTQGKSQLNGVNITSAQPLNFLGGTLTGSGTINGSMNIANQTLLTLQLGGTTSGSGANNYDAFSISGSATLGGNLSLVFKNNFEASVTSSDILTILAASSGSTGTFSNAANGSRFDTTDGFGSFIVNYGGTGVTLSNFVPNTRWLGGNGNWSTGTNWSSSPDYPDNNSSTQYSAVIHSGTVNLDRDITVSRFLLTGGNLSCGHRLTIPDNFVWSSGTISGPPGGSIDLGAGSTSTISSAGFSAINFLDQPTLNNAGTVNQLSAITALFPANPTINNLAGGTWNLGARLDFNGTFNNAGNLVDIAQATTAFFPALNNSGTVNLPLGATAFQALVLEGGGTASGSFELPLHAILQFGSGHANTYSLTSGATINGEGTALIGYGILDIVGHATINTTLDNWSTLNVASGGLLTLKGNFHQEVTSSAITRLSGGTITSTQPLTFQLGSLVGSGTINASVSSNATISPGASAGTLTINGNVSLLNNSKLVMEIGGLTQGTQYDYLSVSSAATLDGILELRMLNGFQLQLQPGQIFTLLTSNSLLSGAFDNVANGARLTTADGLASFQVNYGKGSPYGVNNVVLSDPRAVPEPASVVLFAAGLAVLAVFRRRSQSRCR